MGVKSLIKRGLVVGAHFQFEKGLLIDKIYPHLITIGDDVIIGAGSVVSRDLPGGTVCAGCPAKVICTLEEYKQRILNKKEDLPIYEFSLDPLRMTEHQKLRQKEELKNTFGLKKAINYESFKSLE